MINRRILNLYVFVLLFAVIPALYAEAPELRNVMPNSWRKITRLTSVEEEAFLINNKSLLDSIVENMYSEPFEGYFLIKDCIYTTSRVYKEQAGTDTFYRIITSSTKDPDFNNAHECRFMQNFIYNYNGKLVWLTDGVYNYLSIPGQRNVNFFYYTSIHIVQGNGCAKGVMVATLGVGYITDGEEKGYAATKGQIIGSTRVYYYLMEEVEKKINNEEYAVIQITASGSLVDQNCPLRYGLQNAFDGDPSTSYVENTEDDLMEIDLTYANYEKITKIAVINGYAQNTSLYRRNNRIKTIGIKSPEWNDDRSYLVDKIKDNLSLKDNCLSYQFFNVSFPSGVDILDIYRGEIYNDTCIAELNLNVDGYGWLFGDINEQ